MSINRPAPSRKRRGLKWLAILAALVLFNTCTGLYPLLPIQAVRAQEEPYGLRDAETVRAVWDGGRLVYLRQGPTYFSISEASFHLLGGWYATAPLEIPLDSDCPWGAWIASSGTEARIILFGFVPEGEDPPTFSIRTGEPLASSYFEPVKEIEQVTPQPEIPGEGGSYYLSIYHYPSSADVGRIYGQDGQGAWSLLRFQRTPVFYWPLNW